MQNSHQSQQVSRRTIAKGAAWAAPAVAMTAAIPAYAASQLKACTPAQTVTGTYANGAFNQSTFSNSMSASFGASGISATITTQRTTPNFGLVYNNATYKGFYSASGSREYPLHSAGTQDTNLALTSTAASKCGQSNSIMLSQESRQNHGQVVTFTFNQPVSSVQFKIIDLDQINSNYADNVVVDTLGRGTVKMALDNSADSARVTISNSGTSAATANATSPSNYLGSDSDCRHPMTVTICANTVAGISSFTLKYTSSVHNLVLANRGTQINQMITVSPMTITPVTCIPTTCPTPTNK